MRASQSTKGVWRENHKKAFSCKVVANEFTNLLAWTLFVAHAISNFLTLTLGFVPSLPWKWGRLTRGFILGGGLAAMQKAWVWLGFIGRGKGEDNGLACILILRITRGDGKEDGKLK